MNANAEEIIAMLGMEPHPEGGHYVQTFADSNTHDGRSASTAIYYLIQHGEISHWHRVDAAEVWLYHAGAPLILRLSHDGVTQTKITLGPDLQNSERPQGIVPKGVWQSAQSNGAWTLVTCTVSPGFSFEGFEMAPPGWEPGDALPPIAPPASGIEAELRAREPIFHRPEFGTTREDFDAMMAHDFHEVGASGSRYSRTYILDVLTKRHATPQVEELEVSDFACRHLGGEIYLATYTLLQHPDRLTRRATLWRREAGTWKIVFHQGTLVQQ